MIVAFSTSCAQASVAVIERDGSVIWSGSIVAPQGASGACLQLLATMAEATGHDIKDAEMFVADIGPGSFTGVRVGVTLAKTFGLLYGRPVAGATSFDLISADTTVVLPSKKGEFFIRRLGAMPVRSVDLPNEAYVGFGPGIVLQSMPDAANFSKILDRLMPVDAISFVPDYLIEPSISIPKKPFAPNPVAHA